MLIGDNQYPVQQSILFILLFICLGLAVFLFNRGQGSYYIKYQLMRNNQFFRINQLATTLVNFLYILFFLLPFIIITAITILRGIKNYMEFPAIFVNGLIIILIIYPIHREYYYFQYGIIWFLALSSQLFSQFLTDSNPDQSSGFMEISFIFYTLNCMVFCLALLFNQKIYWQLQQGLSLVKQEQLQKVNSSWCDYSRQKRLPQIFYGGIYGMMSKNQSFGTFLGIYLFSVSILAAYAVIVYFSQKSMLGFTGLVTNVVYDIFILIFSSLKGHQRSIRQLFVMVYVGRLLSFVFGQQYWLFGYCVLYFFVGIFVGNVIIDKHFPLRIQSVKKTTKRVKMNVLKTPQFLLILLTLQIIVLILVEQLSEVTTISKLDFNDRQIPIWQFAILIVLFAWVIILFRLCGRLLTRHIMRIRQMVEYYFGFSTITQYHAYMLLTYILILAGGLYSLLYLNDKNIFLACIFLPIIYHFVFEIGMAWIKNDYCILADFQAYDNKYIKKLSIREIKLKKRLTKVEQLMAKKHKNNQLNSQKESNAQQKESSGLEQGQLTNTALQFTRKSLIHTSVGGKIKLPPIGQKIYNFNSMTKTNEFNLKTSKTPQPQSGNIKMYSRSSEENEILREIQNLKKQRDNMKQLKNWRMDDTLSLPQIWDNFTPYDKTILSFSLLMLLIFIIYSVVSYVWADNVGGLAFSLSIMSFLTSFVYQKITISHRYNIGEIIIALVGFFIGIVFWSCFYSITFGGIVWSLVSIVLYGLCLKTGIQKSLPYVFFPVILSVKIALLLCFICILIGLNFGNAALVIAFAIVIAALFGFLNVYHLFKNGHIPQILKTITGVTIIGIVIALAIIGFVLDVLSNFAVFAITAFILIIGVLIIYSIVAFTKSIKQMIHPHVYSAYGLTIYRFQSQIQQLKTSTNHVKIFNGAMILLVIFASITTLFFKEKYIAIYALSAFLIMQFTQLIFRSIQTYYFFGQCKDHISEKIVNQSFKTVKDKYMAAQIEGQDSPQFIREFEQKKLQAQKAIDQEKKNKLWLRVAELKQEVIKNLQEQQRFLFFWLALIRFGIYTERQNKMNDFLILLQQTKQDLSAAGIIFEALQSADSVQVRYKMVQKQLFSLPPDDYLIVTDILDQRTKIKKKQQKQIQKSHEIQKKKHQEKMQQLFKKQTLMNTQIIIQIKNQIKPETKTKTKKDEVIIKKDNIQEVITKKTDEIVFVEKTPIQEFNEMIKKLGDGIFEDKDFPSNQSSLGKLAPTVKSWRRPKAGQQFITGVGMSPDDVKQGKIGDCYLISSFAVLGQRFLKMALGIDPDNLDKLIWKNQKGAYLVRFYIFSRQVYIKLDDFLPVDQKGNKVFAASEDPLEYWPGILQKAYAKLYGGYHNIISGKCHQVLSEFTGGFPVEILVKQFKSNMNSLWNKMMTFKKNGYLMAAGSPSNPKGDSVASKLGIVQGHAYAILDVREVEKYKLIKLKNPHGSQGQQWSGKFSDNSNLMTNPMKKQLNHSNKRDGIFWMVLQDFISEFYSLYVCSIFNKEWQKFLPITGEWKKNYNSFGRPQNSVKSQNNYQIGITVHKQSTLFVSLRQKNITALNGQNFIYIRVQRNNGKRLQKSNINSQGLCGRAPNLSDPATLSQQILLKSDQYPYTFTIYFCAQKKPIEGSDQPQYGQGKFNVQIFCNDLESKIIQDEQFDKDNLSREILQGEH